MRQVHQSQQQTHAPHPPRRKTNGNPNNGEQRCRTDKGKARLSTPAAAISSTHWAGCDTIRWASSKAFVCFRKPLMTCDRPRKSTQQLRYAGRRPSTGTTNVSCSKDSSGVSHPMVAMPPKYCHGLRHTHLEGLILGIAARTGEAWHSRFAVKRETACVGCGSNDNMAFVLLPLL